MTIVTCLSWHSCPCFLPEAHLWNIHCYPLVSCFCLRCGLASRQITKGRAPLLPLTCSGSLPVSWSVEADCILQDFGSIPLQFYIVLLKQILLCWHTLAIWDRFWMVLLTVMFTWLFVSFLPLVLKQLKPGGFYPQYKRPPPSVLPSLPPSFFPSFLCVSLSFLCSSNTTSSLFICVGKSLKYLSDLMVMSVFQNIS